MNLWFDLELANHFSQSPLLSNQLNSPSQLDYSPTFNPFISKQQESVSLQNNLLHFTAQQQQKIICEANDKISISQRKITQKREKKQKNNNSIKKIGRILLDHIKQYSIQGKTNFQVVKMLRMLSRSSRVGRTEVNKRDKFNTHHLSLLLNDKSQQINAFNLKMTRRILCRYLRKNVQNSNQISEQSKLIYLNTLKCSALRCCNSRLAVRLQMAS